MVLSEAGETAPPAPGGAPLGGYPQRGALHDHHDDHEVDEVGCFGGSYFHHRAPKGSARNPICFSDVSSQQVTSYRLIVVAKRLPDVTKSVTKCPLTEICKVIVSRLPSCVASLWAQPARAVRSSRRNVSARHFRLQCRKADCTLPDERLAIVRQSVTRVSLRKTSTERGRKRDASDANLCPMRSRC